ncbi:MAG TPA: hypothetical protein VD833_25705 [Vicinamibacterales bacterium]|nr:hypothetical protein [Vicinamibacterales bacterium]
MARQATLLLLMLAGIPFPVMAQPPGTPAGAAELTVGYAGFVDDATIDHAVFGGAVRFPLSPRVSIGPELQYMIGPGEDRDLILTGNLTLDLLPPHQRATPFFVIGGGLFRHADMFGSSTEGAFTAGGGVRSWLTERVYVAAELRVGWELHYRLTGTVGVALSR